MASRVIHVAVCICVLFVLRAAGQTTQPAVTRWAETVAHLADALTNENGGSRQIDALVADSVPVREFGAADACSRYYLQRQMLGLAVIAIRAYPWPADTVAADLAADVAAADVPDSVKQQFAPRDEADTKHANLTAQTWLSSMLNPAKDDFVAVIILWEPQSSSTSPLLGAIPREPKQPIFILIKGQREPQTDGFRITQISFGDLGRALN